MKKIISLAIFLGGVCIIAAGALYLSNSLTAPVIAKNNKENIEKKLKEIDKNADTFEEKEINQDSVVKVFVAKKDNKVSNTIYEVKKYGFQSDIDVLISISPEGKFSGFKVISQAETPGYGTKIETDKEYQKQFSTKSITDEIDTITGSTISTTALKEAILEAVKHYEANK